MAKSSKKRYPVIGGPLAGVLMTSDEFASGYGEPGDDYYRPGGRFADLADEYLAFNCGSNRGRGRGGKEWDGHKWVKSVVPSMAWLHRSLFQQITAAPRAPADVHLDAPPRVERDGEEEFYAARFRGDAEAARHALESLGVESLIILDGADDCCARFGLRVLDVAAGKDEIATVLAAVVDGVSVELS